MVDVFDEVEEELRQERYQQLLRKWGPWVGAGAAAIVVGVGAYQFVSWSSQQRAAEASDQYQSAAELLAQGDLAVADAQFEVLANEGPAGYGALSLMRRGEIALSEGRNDDAARLFSQAAERSPEPVTRDLARYQSTLAQFDTLSFDDLVLRLEPLTEGDAALALMAQELMAAAAMRDERWEEARSRYRLLSISLDVPQGMGQRIVEALAYIEQNSPTLPALSADTEAMADDQTAAEAVDSEENGQ